MEYILTYQFLFDGIVPWLLFLINDLVSHLACSLLEVPLSFFLIYSSDFVYYSSLPSNFSVFPTDYIHLRLYLHKHKKVFSGCLQIQ